MRRRHDRADAGFAFGHGRECDAGSQHSFFEQFAGKVHGRLAITDNDRSDWRFTCRSGFTADIETEKSEFLLPEARILPELFHALRFILQNIESRDARGCDRWRM